MNLDTNGQTERDAEGRQEDRQTEKWSKENFSIRTFTTRVLPLPKLCNNLSNSKSKLKMFSHRLSR